MPWPRGNFAFDGQNTLFTQAAPGRTFLHLWIRVAAIDGRIGADHVRIRGPAIPSSEHQWQGSDGGLRSSTPIAPAIQRCKCLVVVSLTHDAAHVCRRLQTLYI